MDWANQPRPFLRFSGAPTVVLPRLNLENPPTWDALLADRLEPREVSAETIGQLFYNSLAVSAWKQVVSPEGTVLSRWALRVNPSSGNLHPTEAYLIIGAVEGVADTPGVYHYSADEHLLEQRARMTVDSVRPPLDALPEGSFLLGLTSIQWREIWKYGERAYRYCQHDVGHAIAALALSARLLGWRLRVADEFSTEQIGHLLGTETRIGPEREHADCLLLVDTANQDQDRTDRQITDGMSDLANRLQWQGVAEPLSREHQDWPRIDEVTKATHWPGDNRLLPGWPTSRHEAAAPDRQLSAPGLIRSRRSAVALDGQTPLERRDFERLLMSLLPSGDVRPDGSPGVQFPFDALSWRPELSLALFVHRVTDLEPGLYVLQRDASHADSLRAEMREEFVWRRPEDSPPELPLFLLAPGDYREHARQLSCQQAIAAEGAFSAGMLARFELPLAQKGAGMYPRLFWEAGVIGQMLYNEAEAAGVRGTGIGCYYDDEFHRLLGLDGHSWQSLYHFTVGGAVEDERLQTSPAYDD